MIKKKIPSGLQAVLWSADIKKLDLEQNKVYIIHQVLAYGDLEDIKWLYDVYSKDEVKKIFYRSPIKIYPKKIYFFIKNFVFDLKDKNIDDQNYLTSIFGPVRPRATKSILSA